MPFQLHSGTLRIAREIKDTHHLSAHNSSAPRTSAVKLKQFGMVFRGLTDPAQPCKKNPV